MSTIAKNYSAALFRVSNYEAELNDCKKIFEENPILIETLNNPRFSKSEKHNIIEELFKNQVHNTTLNFLKLLSDNNNFNYFSDIVLEFRNLVLKSKNIIEAKLIYAFLPDNDELNKLKKTICDKFKASDVILELQEDKSIIGGFIIKTQNTIIDKSIKGTVSKMQNYI